MKIPDPRPKTPDSSQTDTIAAISTAVGPAAIGIVKLSGPKAIEIVSKIFKHSSGKKLKDQATFSLAHGNILDTANSVIDEVLISVMKTPKSYTAEDVVEINCHGGSLATRSVLELVLDKGARLAEPGEFTKRAYLNGRLDLAQAEAVADVIEAKTKLALKAAQGQLGGVLSKKVKSLRSTLLEVIANLQAAIDFSDEDIEPAAYSSLIQKINLIISEIKKLLDSQKEGQPIREGIKTAIIGGPNVGKSSLLNALLQRERAIVTETAGTTRDLIEEIVNVQGLPLVLQDTAGIRNAFDLAEKKGVEISKEALRKADLVLLVIDSSKKLSSVERQLAEEIKDKKTITVLNKCDLKAEIAPVSLKELGLNGHIKVSALKLTGIERLKEKIFGLCFNHQIEPEEILVSNIRQAKALEKGLGSLEAAKRLLAKREPEEIIVFEINRAVQSLGQIIGEISADEVLDEIFSNFCIGK